MHRSPQVVPFVFSSYGEAVTNMTIGLSRIGHSVGWFSRLGEDAIGTRII